ncbi:MAG: hypothetical protein ACREN7_04575 [Candidatus Dormibacteria bacterium]
MRDATGAEPQAERRLLRAFKGMGEGSIDIFFREVQGQWREHYPFADPHTLGARGTCVWATALRASRNW